MSCTEIYAFKQNGEAVHFADVTNAQRGAWAIWATMEQWYLPHKIISRLLRGDVTEIWDLGYNKSIRILHRIAMLSTMDGCLVKRENLPEVIEAFYNFAGTTSLPEQASVLEQILDNEAYIAVGWNQTSINSDNWGTRGGYDPNTEENLPYNCLTQNEHFWLFDELDTEE